MLEQAGHLAEVTARLNTARRLLVLESPDAFDWPSDIPKSDQVAVGAVSEVVRDIAHIAWAVMMLHEISHAHIGATGRKPDSGMQEERLCDAFSISMILDHVADYAAPIKKDVAAIRVLRSMGIMTGIFAISILGKDNDGIHPPARERLQRLFDAVGSQPAKRFWLFAVTLVMGALEARGKSFSLKDLSLGQAGATALVQQLRVSLIREDLVAGKRFSPPTLIRLTA
jgi:hypothetical protein